MSATVELLGKPLAAQVRASVAEQAARRRAGGLVPAMTALLASDDPASLSYAQSKAKAAAKLGIDLEVVDLGADLSQADLEEAVGAQSARSDVHGVLLELPVTAGLDAEPALRRIHPHKDVDGLTPHNLGLIMARREHEAILPATPQACVMLAESYLPLAGRLVGLVGRGRTVGRPLAEMLVNRDATVTVCHTKTPDLRARLEPCEVVVVAAGRAGLIGSAELREGHVVVDAGINYVDGKLVGDVDAESVAGVVAALTPVPGGVGPLTTAIVFANLMRAIALQLGEVP